MINIRALPAPKLAYPKLAAVPFVYALALVVLSSLQLLGVGGFDFGGISYATPGQPFWVVGLACAEIFALPFVLRFSLSPLARVCSAVLTLITPFIYMAYLFSLQNQGLNEFGVIQLLTSAALVLAGVASFAVLNGPTALQKISS